MYPGVEAPQAEEVIGTTQAGQLSQFYTFERDRRPVYRAGLGFGRYGPDVGR
jgi:hypothetical protein